MRPLSLVVPVLSDTSAWQRLLADIAPSPGLEIIIVDGAHDPELDRVAAARADVRLIRSAAGRGRQMNAGAAIARGDWLLFLHADSRLPADWRTALDDSADDAVGGWFRFAVDDHAWQARMIERGVALRVRVLGLPYGDQGVFVRRSVFRDMGGYRELALMEDVEFIQRLRRRGRVVEVPAAIVTSARRWHRDGWFRRSGRNLALLALYFAGVSPTRLARWY